MKMRLWLPFIIGVVLATFIPYWMLFILWFVFIPVAWLDRRHTCNPGPIERALKFIWLRPYCWLLGHEFAIISRVEADWFYKQGMKGAECGWCGYIEKNWLSLVDEE